MKIRSWPWRYILPVLLVIACASVFVIAWQLDNSMRSRLENGWFVAPTEFFAASEKFTVDQSLNPKTIVAQLNRWGWRERLVGQPLHQGDFAYLTGADCREALPAADWLEEFDECLGVWPPQEDGPRWLALSEKKLRAIYDANGRALSDVRLPPERFAQFYDNQPILRTVVGLGDIPLECSQAVTAIEDADFLEHRGISPTAIMRAVVRNLSKARFAEGASTITQQLVKNYFLTSEKTLRRKLMEQILAVLLELRFDKDSILVNYLNVIYMGQKGTFQVLGFAAAADNYFSKPLRSLGLPECALLAAIINNPGRYNPFKKPEAALARRNLVLSRMAAQNMISEEEKTRAAAEPLMVRESPTMQEPAPYFVQAVVEEMKNLGITIEDGLKIYTTLSPRLQDQAQKQVAAHLSDLEKQHPALKAPGKLLQGAALVVDVATGGVSAFVSGRDFKTSQFNRLTNSRRQPGSLFKPIVFLAALETDEYHQDSVIADEPWTHKYEGQSWSPMNYDKKFRGEVTLKQALAQSLNVPTAKLAVQVGIPSLIELARRLGIESELVPVPSLALGAAEVRPWELGQVYLTLARHGSKVPLYLIDSIFDFQGNIVFRSEHPEEQVVSTGRVDELIEMLRETFRTGSAMWMARLGLTDEPAGKTGTTSDTRDNWFVGFNDKRLTLIWVGFDDNTPTNLTGASAASPLWHKVQY